MPTLNLALDQTSANLTAAEDRFLSRHRFDPARPQIVPPQTEPEIIPPRRVSYVTRHWRGELSLGQSFWINGMPVCAALAAVSAYVEMHPNQNDPMDVLASVGAAFAVYIWSIVGIWRAANNHKRRTGSRFWPALRRGG
jgi:hypothetical protein